MCGELEIGSYLYFFFKMIFSIIKLLWLLKWIFRGLDSSYHMQTNDNVRRGIVWGVSTQSIHEHKVLFSSSVYISKRFWEFWSNCSCTKGGPKIFIIKLTINVLISSNSRFHLLLSYGIVLNLYLVHFCYNLHLGSKCLPIGGSWSAHGLLEFRYLNCG